MKLNIYLLTIKEEPKEGSYTKRFMYIDYNDEFLKNFYGNNYDIENIGKYTGREKSACILCKEIINN